MEYWKSMRWAWSSPGSPLQASVATLGNLAPYLESYSELRGDLVDNLERVLGGELGGDHELLLLSAMGLAASYRPPLTRGAEEGATAFVSAVERWLSVGGSRGNIAALSLCRSIIAGDSLDLLASEMASSIGRGKDATVMAKQPVIGLVFDWTIHICDQTRGESRVQVLALQVSSERFITQSRW